MDLAQAGLNERIQGMTGTFQQDKGCGAATLRQVDSGLVLLDLDKCSIFGNDGNDLGIALQWMECPYQSVRELYSLLVSPQLKPAYRRLRTLGNYRCVIYTMRATFLLYRQVPDALNIPAEQRSLCSRMAPDGRSPAGLASGRR